MLVNTYQKSLLTLSLLATLLVLIPSQSLAQRYHIQTFLEQDGVSSNTVYNVSQDSQGNLWFATRSGLTVFNGANWRPIGNETPNSPYGGGKVNVDDNDTVWWASLHSPFSISKLENGLWEKLPAPASPNSFTEIVDLKTWVDATGNTTLVIAPFRGHLQIWKNGTWLTPATESPILNFHSLNLAGSSLVVTTSTGLFTLDLNSPLELRPLPLQLPDEMVHGTCTDTASNLTWIVGDSWIGLFKDQQLVDTFPFPGLFQGKKKPGSSICIGPNGGIYFSDYSHLYHFHPKWGLEKLTPANGIVTDGANHVMMDREKIIWICSSRGISKIMSRRLACYDSDHGLLGDEVSSVIQRASGEIVLGQRTGLTFMSPTPRTRSFGNVSLVHGRVTDLAEDSEGQLWIAANHQGLGVLRDDDSIQWFGKDEGLTHAVFAIMPHPVLGIFVGAGDGLYRKTGDRFEKISLPGTGVAKNITIRRLVPLSTGSFAIATRGFGLFIREGDTITSLRGDRQDGSNNAFTVFENPDGRIWVGTSGGLFLVEDNKLVKTTAPDPVIDRPVYAILKDQQGRFWFGTDDGAIIGDGQKKTRITTQDGLLGAETNRDAFLCDRDGHIWIGTDSGVSIYRQEFDTPRTVAPVLQLTRMMINGTPYSVDEPLTIAGPLTSLVFFFQAPSFATEEHLVFSARTTMESNIESPLHVIHWPGVLPMTNVPPGQFQVQIVGKMSNGLTTNTITTPLITIIPPLKDRWYARVLMALAVALLMWLLFAYFSGRKYAQRLEDEVHHQTQYLRQSEETARLESERLSSTLESISDGVVVVDGQRRVILFNRAAQALFPESTPPEKGCLLEELLPLQSLNDSSQAERYQQLLENPSGVRLLSEQVSISVGSDRTCWLEISAVPVSGSPGGLVFAFRDVTNRRQTEQNERRSQKLESLGLLAGGIAHDFNNLLTIMMGNLSLAQSTLVSSQEETRQLDNIRLASNRAQNLIRQLLTFAKGGGPVLEPTSLAPIIRDSTTFNLSGSNIDCQVDIPNDLDMARVDADQISQVIGNLVINARQAMSEGGKLIVSASNAEKWPGFSPEMKVVVIEVQDHGVGISEKDQARIFDPYFTTKELGSGLGLAIAHSIAKKHNGMLMVSSTLGHGSLFRLILPACGRPGEVQKRETDQEATQLTQSLNILFMDDEEDIRNLVQAMLQNLNHRFTGVAHGESARATFSMAEKEGCPFDLVILDLTIAGGMGGLATLGELRKIDPLVKVVVASGYSDDPVMANFQKYGFSGILSKPFSQESLQRVIGGRETI